MTDKSNNAKNQQAFRARLAEKEITELRGVFAKTALHAEIKKLIRAKFVEKKEQA